MSYENSRTPPSADGRSCARLVLECCVRRALWGSERWETSVHPAGQSLVSDGPFAGHALGDVFPDFPLLLKTIASDAALSVQVHPNEVTCRVTGGEPKSEMWCALADSVVYAGLRPGVGPAELAEAIRTGDIGELLVRHCLGPGDVISIPGGLVHAIDGGSLLYEVQQSSDTTFRLYDWGRVDADGRPRELHVGKALEAIDYSLPAPVPCRSLETPFFAFRQERLAGELHVGGDGRFTAIRSAAGAFSLDGEDFPEGSSVLLPPSVSGTLRAAGAWLLVTDFGAAPNAATTP